MIGKQSVEEIYDYIKIAKILGAEQKVQKISQKKIPKCFLKPVKNLQK